MTIYSYQNLVFSISPFSLSPLSLFFLSLLSFPFLSVIFSILFLIRSSYWNGGHFDFVSFESHNDHWFIFLIIQGSVFSPKNSWGAKDREDEREKEEKENKEEKVRNNCDSIILLIFTRKWEGWFLMKWKMLIHFFLLIRSLIKPLNLDYKNDFWICFSIIFLLSLSLSFSLSLFPEIIIVITLFSIREEKDSQKTGKNAGKQNTGK